MIKTENNPFHLLKKEIAKIEPDISIMVKLLNYRLD